MLSTVQPLYMYVPEVLVVRSLTECFHRNRFFDRAHFSPWKDIALKFSLAWKEVNLFPFRRSAKKREKSHRKRRDKSF